MCLQIFVAADKPLPIIAANEASPALSVRALWPELEKVRRQFSKPFVYDVAAWGGCACAFAYNPDDADVLEEVARLRAYLLAAVREVGPVELFTCWAGDEEAEPLTRLSVTAHHFSDEAFGFDEKQFFTIGPAECVAGLHAGTIWTSDDFDAPLPDEFWLGEEK